MDRRRGEQGQTSQCFAMNIRCSARSEAFSLACASSHREHLAAQEQGEPQAKLANRRYTAFGSFAAFLHR